MTKEQQAEARIRLEAEILKGENPVCLHALGQGLVNELCTIIREYNERYETLIKILRK